MSFITSEKLSSLFSLDRLKQIAFMGWTTYVNDFIFPKGTESDFSRSSAPSSKESKKTAKEKGSKEKGKGDEPIHDDNFKKGFKPDESSFLPEIKTGIEE